VGDESRSAVPAKKSWRDRLIATAQQQPDWLWGFQDEVWWSRVSQPHRHSWAPAGQPLRLVEQTVAKKATAKATPPKAVACYGAWVRGQTADGTALDALWLRFVAGRPVGDATTAYLAWCCAQATALGKRVLLLVWDNAMWHVSARVRRWVGQHNRTVKQRGDGVRLLLCRLPTKSPWLNPIEPKWQHGKEAIVEPSRSLTNEEIRDRVCAYYQVTPLPLLTISQEVA
jgi:hypothetical protein